MTYNAVSNPGVGVVVGRFQTPTLHDGHLTVLNAANQHNKMLVLLGVCASPGSYRQELDYETRRLLISRKYPDAVIQPIYDMASNELWSTNLDSLIRKMFPFSAITIYHGRESFVPYYEGKLEDRLVDVGDVDELSATALREKSYEIARASEDFRHGVFYGLHNCFPRINPTVDVAITRMHNEFDAGGGHGVLQVLLGRKEDHRGWRFPGGFIDITDPTAEHAAIREAQEETSLLVTSPTYISSRKVDDWRNTERNSVLTTFYHFPYESGHAQGNDDLPEVKWFAVDDLGQVNIVPVHKPLVEDLIKFLKERK